MTLIFNSLASFAKAIDVELGRSSYLIFLCKLKKFIGYVFDNDKYRLFTKLVVCVKNVCSQSK